MKLADTEELNLLDCSHAARDLFNAIPRLSEEDQQTLINYIQTRTSGWLMMHAVKP